MSVDELRALNKEVCSRIRAMYASKDEAAKSTFHIGGRVSFKSGKHHWAPTVVAKILAINAKSVTCQDVTTSKKWRVAPSLLTPLETLFGSEPVNPAPAVPAIKLKSEFKSPTLGYAGPLTAGQKAAATRRANAEAARENAWEAANS